MNTSDIIAKVSEKVNLPKTAVKEVLKSLEDEVLEGLKKEDFVRFGTLGTFKKSFRSERKGVNPQTGEVIDIPSQHAVTFKQSATTKKVINQ